MTPNQGFCELFIIIIDLFWIWVIVKVQCKQKLYANANLISEKILVPELKAKVLLSSQIALFLNWVNLKNEFMNQPEFLYVDTYLEI